MPVDGRGEGRTHVGIADPADAGELLGDDRRLRPTLRRRGEVLPLAAAAGREVRAAGEHAVRARRRHALDAGTQIAGMALDDARRDTVAGCAVGHEDHLSAVMGERVEAEGQALDVELEELSRHPARRAGRASPRW